MMNGVFHWTGVGVFVLFGIYLVLAMLGAFE